METTSCVRKLRWLGTGTALVLGYLVLVASLSAAVASSALAQGSLTLLGGYGASTDSLEPSPYRWGLGVRGGYTFQQRWYVGGSGLFYAGERDQGRSGSFATTRMLHLTAEVGYQLKCGKLIFMPLAGMGPGVGFARLEVGQVDERTRHTFPVFSFGGAALYPFRRMFFGGEWRYTASVTNRDFVAEDRVLDAFSLFGLFGVRFGAVPEPSPKKAPVASAREPARSRDDVDRAELRITQ